MEMSTVKNVTIGAIVLGAVFYLAYINRDRIKRFIIAEQDERPNRKESQVGDAMAELGQAFLMYADNFQGLYEPIYKASIGAISQERIRNVLMEWDIRMGNISQAPICLKSWWSTVSVGMESLAREELIDRAQRIIQMIHMCGIIRDNKKELVAVDDTNMFYQNDDGVMWSIGQKLRVESPCWYIQCTPVRVIEKGYCELIN